MHPRLILGMKNSDIVQEVINGITDPKRWTQNAFARNKDGGAMVDNINGTDVCSRCSVGELYHVLGTSQEFRFQRDFLKVIGDSIIHYNDHHPHDEVLDAWKRLKAYYVALETGGDASAH